MQRQAQRGAAKTTKRGVTHVRSGRPPTPTYLKILRGNPGQRRLPQNEPKPDILANVPDPPAFLEDYAREEWLRIAAQLCRLGLLTAVDIHPLAAYCQSYARWRTAEEVLAEMKRDDPKGRGLMLRAGNGSAMHNPLVQVATRASMDMLRFAVEFGLTPSARARIAAGPDGDGGGSKFSGLLAS